MEKATSNGWRTAGIWITAVIFGLFLLWKGCDMYIDHALSLPNLTTEPALIYTELIDERVHEDVSDIQRVGHGFKGWSAWLRCNVPAHVMGPILVKRFKRVPWKSIAEKFVLESKEYDLFEPSWNPESVQNKEAYVFEEGLKWVYLLYDRDRGVLYCYGSRG